jgi:hypothetical protein
MSSFGYGSTYDACAGSTSIVVYAPPGYTTPMVGMIFYDNSNLTVPHNGGSSGQWFLLQKGGTTWAAQVFTDGEVLDYVDCSTLVTPTPTTTQTPPVTPTNTSTPASTQTPTTTTTLTATPTSTTPAKTEVYFNICGSQSAAGGGAVQVTARAVDGSGNAINVDTNVTVYFQWVGDLASTVTGSVTINSGFNCNDTTAYGAQAGENVDTFGFNGTPSPTSSTTQNYNNNIADTDNTCLQGC